MRKAKYENEREESWENLQSSLYNLLLCCILCFLFPHKNSFFQHSPQFHIKLNWRKMIKNKPCASICFSLKKWKKRKQEKNKRTFFQHKTMCCVWVCMCVMFNIAKIQVHNLHWMWLMGFMDTFKILNVSFSKFWWHLISRY